MSSRGCLRCPRCRSRHRRDHRYRFFLFRSRSRPDPTLFSVFNVPLSNARRVAHSFGDNVRDGPRTVLTTPTAAAVALAHRCRHRRRVSSLREVDAGGCGRTVPVREGALLLLLFEQTHSCCCCCCFDRFLGGNGGQWLRMGERSPFSLRVQRVRSGSAGHPSETQTPELETLGSFLSDSSTRSGRRPTLSTSRPCVFRCPSSRKKGSSTFSVLLRGSPASRLKPTDQDLGDSRTRGGRDARDPSAPSRLFATPCSSAECLQHQANFFVVPRAVMYRNENSHKMPNFDEN